jgi:transcriptional regulator with XRE-family HTH domain
MSDGVIVAIIEALQQIRDEEFLSIAGMARQLGFSGSHLSLILRRQRRPGARFLRTAAARYPAVRRILAQGLAEQEGDRRRLTTRHHRP